MVSFLELPTEIRLQIYQASRTPAPASQMSSLTDHFDFDVWRDILYVNQKICEEAEPTLYQDNAYHHFVKSPKLYHSFSFLAGGSWWPSVEICRSIRLVHVHIELPLRLTASIWYSDTLVESLALRITPSCGIFLAMPALQELRVSTRGRFSLAEGSHLMSYTSTKVVLRSLAGILFTRILSHFQRLVARVKVTCCDVEIPVIDSEDERDMCEILFKEVFGKIFVLESALGGI